MDIHRTWTEYVPNYEPSGGRQGWRAVCSICGLLGKPAGYAYAQLGAARTTATKHTLKMLRRSA